MPCKWALMPEMSIIVICQMCENEFVATLELKQITEDQFSYTNHE